MLAQLRSLLRFQPPLSLGFLIVCIAAATGRSEGGVRCAATEGGMARTGQSQLAPQAYKCTGSARRKHNRGCRQRSVATGRLRARMPSPWALASRLCSPPAALPILPTPVHVRRPRRVAPLSPLKRHEACIMSFQVICIGVGIKIISAVASCTGPPARQTRPPRGAACAVPAWPLPASAVPAAQDSLCRARSSGSTPCRRA
jgi:hypothetical protein